MNKEIYEKLLNLVATSMSNVDMRNVNEDTRLIEDLRYDSLGLLTLVMNVEKEFNVKFNVPYQINTIKDIYDFIDKKRSK